MGLRERKKRQTRELISGIATMLFGQRGFDAVTVAEVAEAAGVSQKTVFNYFPRKEDLFLDRLPDLIDLVTRAVRGRPEGATVLAAVRGVVLDLLREGHPLSAYPEPTHVAFYRVVVGSPALQARAREFVQELEDLLTTMYAEAPAPGASAGFAAAVTVAAYRSVYFSTAARLLAGEHFMDVREGLAGEYTRAFDAAERAIS
ncbi:TetR/AcrR family transcriptional regulator [Actinoplanes sp. L3-i22]|uniref:TetR/AcrR family transcriptional regulator n=1 Tax=Actinoplanes sp. L3-i22 TaxID=2836373 RepID=UPI00210333A6|nr:TetR family transcriptional regulator [Actinoplanes sp. L3-i22]